MPVTLSDKLQHLGSYAVLAAYFGGIVRARAFAVTLFLLLAMSIALEFLQGAGGHRTFDVVDMVFNALGIAVGWALVRYKLSGWCRVIERWVLA